MTGKAGTKKATSAQIIRINDILKEHITVHDDGICSYAEGFSDEIVAQIVGVTSVSSVEKIRKDLFGNLRSKKMNDQYYLDNDLLRETREMAGDLTLKYGWAKQQINELILRHNDLVMMLALNKVVDCRHLVIKSLTTHKENNHV